MMQTMQLLVVVDKAARGGETVLKHLKTAVLLLKQYVFVIIHRIIGVFGGVFPSKQREK